MSFGGSAAAMVQSIRNNLAQKRSNRYEKKDKSVGIKIEKTEYNFAKVSDAKLDKIKKDIREKIKVRKRNELVLFIAIFATIIILGTIILS